MIQTTIKRLSYKIRHEFLTINTLVITGAAIITLGWVIGSLDVMQRNYERQRTLDQKVQQQQLIDLETRNLELETAYLKTTEYQERAARQYLGLASPGEHALILPSRPGDSEPASSTPAATTDKSSAPVRVSNYEQWLRFLFGSRAS
jgi:hypothetical protein